MVGRDLSVTIPKEEEGATIVKDKANEIQKAIVDELEAIGATHYIENRSKHLMLHWEKDGIKGRMPLSLSPSDWRASMNAKRDIRRSLRERGLLSSTSKSAFDPVTPTAAVTLPTTISAKAEETNKVEVAPQPQNIGADDLVLIKDQPRMRDVDIGSALGYARPLNVRKLIEDNFAELKTYGEVVVEAGSSSSQGGRPSQAYLLNQEQSLLVAMFSRTARSVEVRRQVIKAYSDWTEAHAETAVPQVSAAPEPEILANGQAIEEIIARLAPMMSKAPVVAEAKSSGKELVDKGQFNEVMSQMVAWLKQRFERTDRLLNEVYNARVDTGEGISRRIEQSHKAFLEDIKASVADSNRSVAEAVERIKVKIEAQEQPAKAQGLAPKVNPPSDIPKATLDLVSISEIYLMIGIDPQTIPEMRSLGQWMRHSLVNYCRSNGLKTYRRQTLNQGRFEWPRDTVSRWYREIGREGIIAHIEQYS